MQKTTSGSSPGCAAGPVVGAGTNAAALFPAAAAEQAHTTNANLRALGVVRRDVPAHGIDMRELAGRHGFRVVFTVVLDTGSALSAFIVRQQIAEHGVQAVVVPGFEHIKAIRWPVTAWVELITPMRVYPQGFQWPACGLKSELRA